MLKNSKITMTIILRYLDRLLNCLHSALMSVQSFTLYLPNLDDEVNLCLRTTTAVHMHRPKHGSMQMAKYGWLFVRTRSVSQLDHKSRPTKNEGHRPPSRGASPLGVSTTRRVINLNQPSNMRSQH